MTNEAAITRSVLPTRPPRLKGLPYLGNALDMARDPGAFFLHSYLRHGPIYDIHLMGRTTTVLAGPEAALFMSRNGSETLRSREFWQGLVDEFDAEKTLVSTDGEIHGRLRKVMKRGYSRSAVRGRYDQLLFITDQVIEREWRSGGTVTVVPAMQRLASEQLGIMVAGAAPGDYVPDLRHFIRTVLNVLVTKQRPRLLLHSPAYRRAKARVFELGRRMIDAYDPSQVDPDNPTLLDDIFAASETDPSLFKGNELMLAALGPYFAGLDTVANTTAALIYAVLKHPEVKVRLVEGVDAVFAEGEVTEETLHRMPVMYGTFMETLRLYPIAVAAMRHASRDFEFEGYQVEEGRPLYMAITVSHHLPRFFEEPERFDIERFTRRPNPYRQPGAFAPFSLGDHTCLGAGMAEVQIMLTMARLFHCLDLALDPPGYELKIATAPVPGPESGFRVRVLGRRN